jgi:hypothetical protein
MILNPQAFFLQAIQLHRPEIHVPQPVIDFFETDVETGAG